MTAIRVGLQIAFVFYSGTAADALPRVTQRTRTRPLAGGLLEPKLTLAKQTVSARARFRLAVAEDRPVTIACRFFAYIEGKKGVNRASLMARAKRSSKTSATMNTLKSIDKSLALESELYPVTLDLTVLNVPNRFRPSTHLTKEVGIHNSDSRA